MSTSSIPGAGAVGVLSAVLGDHKHGYQAADHAGWILENGRLLTTLTATQQTAATALGFGANLLNADGMVPIGAGTKALRSTGGAATATVLQTHLPSINLIGGAHSHSVSDPGHAHNPGSVGYANAYAAGSNQAYTSGGVNGFSTANIGATTISGTGLGINSSGNLSVPLGGSGSALPIQNPYIARNSFIYLGA